MLIRARFLILGLVLVFGFFVTQQSLAAEKYSIVAGTEHVADTVRDLLDGEVEILTLIPASSCPGHHDIRASDMAFFGKANMAILHQWQKKMPPIQDTLRAAKFPASSIKTSATHGSLLVPEHQISLAKEISTFLQTLPGADQEAIRQRLAARIDRITALASECKEIMSPYRGLPVFSALMQKEFTRWTGLNVAGTYGRAEDLSPALLMELASKGKRSGVRVVVDNLQSGADAGSPLAREMGVPHIVFSNFPGFSKDVPDYESLVRHNVNTLRDALAN